MKRHSESNTIDAISLHFTDGSSRIYTSKELAILIYDLNLDISLLFAVVNLMNRSSPLIIRDVQKLLYFLGLKF